ncbi:MAG: sigma-70 family RNA polymerase sigma factor, partial [Candidatus Omnitrophica bacterium]|nr:sigma-70 family RNA polymerase sigma factor [Candidatus Omnitrophota bacterium]
MEFYDLLKKLSPKIRAIAYKLKGHFSAFNEEDLYQEAVVNLWQEYKKDKLLDKTDSYILQGCYFFLKNYIRKNRDKARLLSIEDNLGEEGAPFEELFLKDEKTLYVRDYLDDLLIADTIRNNGLSVREKEILTYYADGLTTREIGKEMGASHV